MKNVMPVVVSFCWTLSNPDRAVPPKKLPPTAVLAVWLVGPETTRSSWKRCPPTSENLAGTGRLSGAATGAATGAAEERERRTDRRGGGEGGEGERVRGGAEGGRRAGGGRRARGGMEREGGHREREEIWGGGDRRAEAVGCAGVRTHLASTGSEEMLPQSVPCPSTLSSSQSAT